MDHYSKVPKVVFKTRVRDAQVGGDNPYRWQDVTTDDVFRGKKIVVFALPGAYTPTCDSTHLPGYEAKYDELRAAGADEVYCMAVNDAFVMHRWSRELGVSKVKMLPDGNADFTRMMGMLVKKENLGFGLRSWRYSMHVVDGEIKRMFIEEGFCDNYKDDPFKVSDAETMLHYLKSNK